MDEFSLIENYFKQPNYSSDANIILGIGDDAACLQVPPEYNLLVSTDTLVADVHFLTKWDAYDIAARSLKVNISDIAAMGGIPTWVSLALTLPDLDGPWLTQFSLGVTHTLEKYNLALIGGDTTRGPLTISITIHGLIPKGKQISRKGAKPGDIIWVSGKLGAAALAVKYLTNSHSDSPCSEKEFSYLLNKLKSPIPRVDLGPLLQTFASSAIDISDGLSADLNHVCQASNVGACLFFDKLPIDTLVSHYEKNNAIEFTLNGGDDYELCFTIPAEKNSAFEQALNQQNLQCYPVGHIEKEPGLRGLMSSNKIINLIPKGYTHF